jgi:hypothetical protein
MKKEITDQNLKVHTVVLGLCLLIGIFILYVLFYADSIISLFQPQLTSELVTLKYWMGVLCGFAIGVLAMQAIDYIGVFFAYIGQHKEVQEAE